MILASASSADVWVPIATGLIAAVAAVVVALVSNRRPHQLVDELLKALRESERREAALERQLGEAEKSNAGLRTSNEVLRQRLKMGPDEH